jgi:hypothetical protein
MSWTASLPEPVAVSEVTEALASLEASPPVEGEPQEQFEAAKDAARVLVESGAVGDRPVRINLNGHANPGHEPTEGYANDMITVSISQA